MTSIIKIHPAKTLGDALRGAPRPLAAADDCAQAANGADAGRDRTLYRMSISLDDDRFRALADQELVGFFVADLTRDTLAYVNPHLCRSLGYTEAQVTGVRTGEILGARDRSALADCRVRLQRGDASAQISVRLRAADGSARDTRLHCVLAKGGGKPALLALVDDRTERNQLEARIGELADTLERRVHDRTRELERANGELDAFAHSVSHDLRSPVRTMIGFSNILLEDGRLDATSASYVRRMESDARQMLRLIDDLLNLSRVSRNELLRQDVDLSQLAHVVGVALRAAHLERKVEFTIEPGLRVNADPGLLRVLLENLLRNAWKYTARTAAASVHLGRVHGEGTPVYYVGDNGAGFDMRHVHKLFGAFQRLHRDDEFEGAGIGLSIVKRVVERHGGRVWAEGKIGGGATFYFTFE